MGTFPSRGWDWRSHTGKLLTVWKDFRVEREESAQRLLPCITRAVVWRAESGGKPPEEQVHEYHSRMKLIISTKGLNEE